MLRMPYIAIFRLGNPIHDHLFAVMSLNSLCCSSLIEIPILAYSHMLFIHLKYSNCLIKKGKIFMHQLE